VGVSAIIDPDGTMHEESSLFTQDVLQGQVVLRTTQTIATRVGTAPEIALSALAVLLLLTARGGSRRQGGPAVPTRRTGDPVPA